MEYILTYDQGTSGVKAALVSLRGEMSGCVTETYPLYSLYPGYAEQDPEDYWKAICKATAELFRQTGISPRCVRGLVFGAIWKSIIPVDRDIRPLRRSLIWLDSRARKEADKINDRLGGNQYMPNDYWAKLLWLYDNEPQIYEKAYKIIGV